MKPFLHCFIPAVGATALITGCTVMAPTGPSIVALPTADESLNTFQRDDYACRDYASQHVNPSAASQGATNNAVNSAAAGTLGGAAVGALFGAATGHAGAGAAIGAGSGLLVGGAAGAGNAQNSVGSLQAQYDGAYAQCMASKGNTIQSQSAPVYFAPAPVYYAPPPPVHYYGPRYW